MAHELEEYDLDQMEKAKQLLMKVYTYHYGDSKMRSQIKRLETIISKIEILQNLGGTRR